MPLNLRRRQRGFTLVEALLLTLIIGIGTMAWLSTMTGFMKVSKKGRASFQMVLEQRAISKLVDSMPAAAVTAASVGCMHPYKKFISPNSCQTNMAAGKNPSASEVLAWQELSKAVFKWVSASNAQTLPPDEVLSRTYFNDSLVPKMQAAGCLECHAGGAPKGYALDTTLWLSSMSASSMRRSKPEIEQRDFTSYDHIVRDFIYTVSGQNLTSPALAAKGIFNSALGQTMLMARTTVDDYLGDSHGISSTIVFTSKEIQFELKTVIPNARSRVGPTEFCPVITEATACDQFETLAAGCTERCSAYGPAPTCSCGKDCTYSCGDPPCIEYTADFQCLSDKGTEHNGISGISGNYMGQPDYVSLAWESRPTDQCTNIEGKTPCSPYVCDPSPTAPWHANGKCVVVNSCKRHCEETVYSASYSCGKDCFVPARPQSCKSQRWEFDCQVEFGSSMKSANVVSYSVNTQYTDESGEVKSLSTGGALK